MDLTFNTIMLMWERRKFNREYLEVVKTNEERGTNLATTQAYIKEEKIAKFCDPCDLFLKVTNSCLGLSGTTDNIQRNDQARFVYNQECNIAVQNGVDGVMTPGGFKPR